MTDIRSYFSNSDSTKSKKKGSRKRVINESDDENPLTGEAKSETQSGGPVMPIEPEESFGSSRTHRTTGTLQTGHHLSDENENGETLNGQSLGNTTTKGQASDKGRKLEDGTGADFTKGTDNDTAKSKRTYIESGISDDQTSTITTSKVKRVKAESQDARKPVVCIPVMNRSNEVSVRPPRSDFENRNVGENMPKSSMKLSSHKALESVPLIPLPPVGEPVDFKYGQERTGASAPGSKTIPEGADNCLLGLTFVFTGVLQSLERSEAQDLVKRYAGRVTTAPSKNTSFVVLGEQAGPKKIEKIGQLGIKMIDEDGLLQLISVMPAQGGDSTAAQKAAAKRLAEDNKARENAADMAREEAKSTGGKIEKGPLDQLASSRMIPSFQQLWTTKYAPKAIREVVGNKALVDRLAKWLADWPKNLKANFKKPGPEGHGVYRAMLLSGAPGVGKTTSAHLVAEIAGYDILEFNASDTRSKRLLEDGLKGVVNNTSLRGFFSASGSELDTSKRRLVLIMDEVDGMSAGDRGGVGALNAVIKKTTIPIICICNDRSSQKLKPLERTTFDLRFTKPTKDQVRSRIMSIAYKEGLQVSPQAIDQLVEGTGSDIRQIINLLSTYRLTSTMMDQSQGRSGAKNAEKHVVLKPWDIVSKLLSGAIYHERSTVTLNEKIELYFNDHEMSYLMVQENYLNTTPDKVRSGGTTQREQGLQRLKLVTSAARGISDADLVDAMIHGPQQQWSLMPVHAVFSCVRPCSFIAGASGRSMFTSVLGNMSKLSKAGRLLREVRAHLRLRTSGDRHEIRRDYLPALFGCIPKVLAREGTSAIHDVIARMDDYFLTKEDYESLLELGLGENDRETIDSQIAPATKSAFTRQYNKISHPIAFMTSDASTATRKLNNNAEVPDCEDAVELVDEELAADKPSDEDSSVDLKRDKLIRAPVSKLSKKKTTKSAR